MRRVLFISSSGGHWVQMVCIMKHIEFSNFDVSVASCSDINSFNDKQVDKVPDFNKDKIYKTLIGALKILQYIYKKKPDVAVSTGAAPGVIALLFVKVFGGKTIWIDSIANTERLSLSGRIALRFCSVVLTQWPHLADGKKIQYRGRVI